MDQRVMISVVNGKKMWPQLVSIDFALGPTPAHTCSIEKQFPGLPRYKLLGGSSHLVVNNHGPMVIVYKSPQGSGCVVSLPNDRFMAYKLIKLGVIRSPRIR